MNLQHDAGPQIELNGLRGTNPLAFFAALGALAAVDAQRGAAALRWSTAPLPTALLSGIDDRSELLDLLVLEIEAWRGSWIIRSDHDDVKLSPEGVRNFLDDAKQDPRSLTLASALLAEGVTDGKGDSKPTDFHFTAGQQKWLSMARVVLQSVTVDHLDSSLFGRWSYRSKLPSLMWDVADDRVYALSATDPSKDKKLSEPGAEAMAVLGLTLYPVVAGDRTMTPGCAGRWKRGSFSWPLWQPELSIDSTRSLVGSRAVLEGAKASSLLRGFGVTQLLQSTVRRSDQGGYGNFGPPVVAWQS